MSATDGLGERVLEGADTLLNAVSAVFLFTRPLDVFRQVSAHATHVTFDVDDTLVNTSKLDPYTADLAEQLVLVVVDVVAQVVRLACYFVDVGVLDVLSCFRGILAGLR